MMQLLSRLGLVLLVLCGAASPLYASPQVVVTIKPVHALVAGIMDGAGTPDLLMEGAVSPHTYQLRPSEAHRLNDADLVIWVGPGIESAFHDTLGMLPGQVRVAEALNAPGLRLLPARAAGLHRDEAAHDGDEAHDHGDVDPHIWLDPSNAAVLTDYFVAELSAVDPDNAALYRANGAAQKERLQALEAGLRARLAPVADVPFITYHDAFQYFEAAFGLHAAASVAVDAERGPGGRTVMGLRAILREGGAACVFAEPQFEPALIDMLIEDTAARPATLDPLGAGLAPGPAAYDSILENIAASALACLSGDSER